MRYSILIILPLALASPLNPARGLVDDTINEIVCRARAYTEVNPFLARRANEDKRSL
jgi:hypothetical protein